MSDAIVGDDEVFFSTKDIIEAQKFWGEVVESVVASRNMARPGEDENVKKVLQLTVRPILKNFDGEPWQWSYALSKQTSSKWFHFLKSLEEAGVTMKKAEDLKGRVLLFGNKEGSFTDREGKAVTYTYRIVVQKGSKEEALKAINSAPATATTAPAAAAATSGGLDANSDKLLAAIKANPGPKEELMKSTGLDVVSFVKARQKLAGSKLIEEKDGIFIPVGA